MSKNTQKAAGKGGGKSGGKGPGTISVVERPARPPKKKK